MMQRGTPDSAAAIRGSRISGQGVEMADIHELAATYREHYATRPYDNPNEQHREIYSSVRLELTGCVGRLFKNEPAKWRPYRVPRPQFGPGPMFGYSYAKKSIEAGDDHNGMLQIWMGEYTYSWRRVPRPSPTTMDGHAWRLWMAMHGEWQTFPG